MSRCLTHGERPHGRGPQQAPADEGSVMPLIIVFAMVLLTLMMVVINIGSLHIQRQRLVAVADAAALQAADALTEDDFYALGLPDQGQAIQLVDARIQASAELFLRSNPVALDEVRLAQPTGVWLNQGAEVTVEAVARVPIPIPLVSQWAGGIPLSVTSHAQGVTAID